MILRGSIHIKDLATAHYVRIRINRINRIRDENNICIFKKIRDIATVTFGPITDKNILRIQLHTMTGIIPLNGFMQELITLFRTIAAKCFLMP